MSETDTLTNTIRDTPKAQRRMRRAARTRARALAPRRILMLVLSVPLVAGSVALSVYLRTSPYPRTQAVQHLVAMAGCEAAARIGVPQARRGQPGYHAQNDPDGDGVACGTASDTQAQVRSTPNRRQVGGAKFVRP